MKKSFLSIYWWLCLPVFIVLLALCLNRNNPGRYLNFAAWGTLEELESYTRLVNLYNEQEPPYPVRLMHISGQSYEQKLIIMSAAGKPPDVFKAYNGMLFNFYKKGIIRDLTPLINSDSDFDLSRYYEKLSSLGFINGRRIALPLVFSPFVLYYNRNHFDLENIQYPDSSWTWDDFLAASKKLTKRNSAGEITRYGCFIDEFKSIMIRQWGGDHFNESRDSMRTASPQAAEGLQFYINLYKKHNVSIDPMALGFRVDEIFSSERASMIINGRWAAPWLVKHMRKGSFDVAPVPRGKHRFTGLAAHFLVLSATGEKQKAAWDFIKFLAGREAQIITSQDGNNIPAMKEVAESGLFLRNENTPDINNRVFLNELPHAVEWMFEESPYTNTWFLRRNFEIIRDKVSTGQLTSFEGLEEFDRTVNRHINNEKQINLDKSFVGSRLFYTIIIMTILGGFVLFVRFRKIKT